MRDNRQKLIQELQTKDGRIIVLKVWYEQGGMNYFSGGRNSRGYYLSCRIVTRVKHEGYTTEQFSMFSGIKKLLQTAERYSANTLMALEPTQADIDALVSHVLKEEKAELGSPEVVQSTKEAVNG